MGDKLNRLVVWTAVLLVMKVTLSVVMGYRSYLPPDFEADFLLGREAYFWGAYRWAFYTHLAAGPVTLVLGTVLISERFRRWAPNWHRRMGRWQVGCVLVLLVPSGLWMARYAVTGVVAGAGLGMLAVATAICCTAGWRAAVTRRFAQHERWMWRNYLLLCSAVVIRVIGGLAAVLEVEGDWVYPVSTWVSWVGPVAVYEGWRWISSRAGNGERLVGRRELLSLVPPHEEGRDG